MNGKKQSPDITLGLGVAKALELGYKKFVLSIDSSVSIEKFIINHGGTVQRSKVGEANVIDLMLNTKAQAGGEGSSAGFILPEFNFCRDGILTSGFIASMKGTKTFDELIKFMQSFVQKRIKIQVPTTLHDKIMKKILEKIQAKYKQIITIDGIKAIIDDNTWALVRNSNTEDVIRISAESNDSKKVENIQNEIHDLVKQCYDQIK